MQELSWLVWQGTSRSQAKCRHTQPALCSLASSTSPTHLRCAAACRAGKVHLSDHQLYSYLQQHPSRLPTVALQPEIRELVGAAAQGPAASHPTAAAAAVCWAMLKAADLR